MNRPILLLFILLVILRHDSLGNYFTITTDKSSYKHTDTLSYSVFTQLSACQNTQPTAYVYIHTTNQTIVSRQILQLNGEHTIVKIPLTDLDSGFYFISVFGYAHGNNSKLSGNTVCISVDLPYAVTQHLDNRLIEIIPECGKALISFNNRMIVTLKSRGGNPVCDKIFFRNRNQQLIAVCQTNSFGWGTVDLPVISDDSIWLTDTKKNLLSVIQVSNNRLFSNNEVSLHIQEFSGTIIIQIRKGDGASGHRVYLEVYDKAHALGEMSARFINDTSIISIPLPLGNYRNKLLKVLLKNEKAQIIAERYVFSESYDHQDTTGLFCEAISGTTPFYLETGSRAINDALIAFEPEYRDSINKLAEEGFRLGFTNPDYARGKIDYYIYNNQNEIVQAGSSIADSSGLIQISGCNFNGPGYVKFYSDKNEVTGFKEVSLGLTPAEMEKIYAQFSQINKTYIRPAVIRAAALPAADHTAKTLENINLNVNVKNQYSELEKKYINNGMFRDHNSIQVNVEDDRLALNFSLTDYLVRKIPGLFIYNGELRYRAGYVEVYIDEMYIPDNNLNGIIQTNDIGYIRFFRNPISSGLQAMRTGSASNSNSYAAVLQASLAIYRRKYSTSDSKQPFQTGLLVQGFANEQIRQEN
jgi:hypothetical protein